MKFRCIFWVNRLLSLQKCFGCIFTIFASKNEAACREAQVHCGGFHFASKKKGSGPIFSIFCVQKWSCLLLGSDAFWMFSACNVYNKSFGCNFTIYDLCAQKRSGLLLSSDDFWKLSPCQLEKKFWAHFLDFCVQKPSGLLWSSDAFRKFLPCQVYERCSGSIFTVYVYENNAVCCKVQTQFGSFLVTRLINSSEHIIMIYVSCKQTV